MIAGVRVQVGVIHQFNPSNHKPTKPNTNLTYHFQHRSGSSARYWRRIATTAENSSLVPATATEAVATGAAETTFAAEVGLS
jgi:hypothetical protein